MHVNQAIIAFSQSEKLKSGIIWANQMIEMYLALPETDKPGAEKVLKALINMIAAEIQVAKKAAPHDVWQEVDKDMNTAVVMLNSGVTHEAGYHLTQALTKVTTVGQQSMTLLTDEGLL